MLLAWRLRRAATAWTIGLLASSVALPVVSQTLMPPVDVVTPVSVQPGKPLTIVVHSVGKLQHVRATVLRPNGRALVSNQGFPFRLPDGRAVSLVLLGIPTTAPPGSYRINISATSFEGQDLTFLKPLEVIERDFGREHIGLDTSLSELRERPDPRKEREAEQLSRILLTFNPTQIFQNGQFQVPLSTWKQTSGFGDRRRYEYADGGTARTIHSGVDLAAPEGAPVFAAGKGRVRFAGHWLITGNTVVLEHLPGVYSLYFHMRAVRVTAGDFVERGQEIGEVGSTGLATGPHLHWEIRIGGVAVDPFSLLDVGLVDVAKILHTTSQTSG